MNKAHTVCFGFLIFVGGCAVAAGEPPPLKHEPVVLITAYYDNDFGKLDGHGKLVYQETKPYWRGARSYYPRGSKEGVMLQDNISSMNVFLAAEVRRPQTVRTFVKKYLSSFLDHNLGGFADDAINPGVASWQDPVWPEHAPTPSPAAQARLKAKFRSYVLPCETVVSGNHWVLEENVLTNEGGVQHRLIKGQVMPLHIDSYLCETREPNGTFQPVLVTR